MIDSIVTALHLINPPPVRSFLYRKVIGPHVKLAQDIALPLSSGIPVGDPIAEVLLKPDEKAHRVAYRAILRDAVAKRIRELGGFVEKKKIEICGIRLVYDVTLSNDKRLLAVFPLGDVDPIKALGILKRFKERVGFIEVKGSRVYLGPPVCLKNIRGGVMPEPKIVLYNEKEDLAYTDDPVKPFMEGRGRALEGGEELGIKPKVHVFSDDRRLLETLKEFSRMFFFGHGSRLGYERLMRTRVEIVEEELIGDLDDVDPSPRNIYFIALLQESPSSYRKARNLVVRHKAIIHMFKRSSLIEFYEALKRGKKCGSAALAIDLHKKLGLVPYRLDLAKLFDKNVPVYGITQISGLIAGAKYTADGRFLEAFVYDDVEELIKRMEKEAIVYSQGVRGLAWREGAVMYLDRKTPVGIITPDMKPARGAYFFTPNECFVTTGFNCRALRIRFIRTNKYKPYTLALYTYRSSRLLQRDFPVLVPPMIRAIDRMREHIQMGIFEKHSVRPWFL